MVGVEERYMKRIGIADQMSGRLGVKKGASSFRAVGVWKRDPQQYHTLPSELYMDQPLRIIISLLASYLDSLCSF
jgi:hypothetical protein